MIGNENKTNLVRNMIGKQNHFSVTDSPVQISLSCRVLITVHSFYRTSTQNNATNIGYSAPNMKSEHRNIYNVEAGFLSRFVERSKVILMRRALAPPPLWVYLRFRSTTFEPESGLWMEKVCNPKE